MKSDASADAGHLQPRPQTVHAAVDAPDFRNDLERHEMTPVDTHEATVDTPIASEGQRLLRELPGSLGVIAEVLGASRQAVFDMETRRPLAGTEGQEAHL